MADSSRSVPAILIGRFAITLGIVYLLSTKFSQYFYVFGGLFAYIVVASLFTIMNIIVRPILHAIFMPIHAVVGIIATILCNWLFLVLTMKIAAQFNPATVIFEVHGGTFIFILIAIFIGLSNWLMKMFARL